MKPGRLFLTAFLAWTFSTACSSSKEAPAPLGDGAAVNIDGNVDNEADSARDGGQTPEIADGAEGANDAVVTSGDDGPAQDVIDREADSDAGTDTDAESDRADDLPVDHVLVPDVTTESDSDDAPVDRGDDGTPVDGSPDDGDVLPPPCSGGSCPPDLGAGHLQLWLRGDRGVDCVAGRVQRWADLSLHHNDGTPPAGQWGPLCGDAVRPINDRAVVSFPRSPDPIALASEHVEVDFSSLAESALTIAVVEKRTRPMTTTWIIGTPLPFPDQVNCTGVSSVNEGKGLIVGYPVPIAALASFWAPACGIRQVPVAPPPAAQASTFVMIYVPGTGIAVFLNGKQGNGSDAGVSQEGGLTQVASNTTPDARPIGFLGRGFIGRGFEETSAGIDSRYYGSIAEVVVYNAALDESERTRLEAYFHDEWNTLTTP